MKKISLTNSSEKAIVDDIVYDVVNQYSWHVGEDGIVYTTIEGQEISMAIMVIALYRRANN
jgi:hypothetical protein